MYRPSPVEWLDPLGFIRSVQAECAAWGMCRIVPPAGWQPPFALDSTRFSFSTRLQSIHRLQSGKAFTDSNRRYSLRQFQLMADTFRTAFFPADGSQAAIPAERVEEEYWRIVTQGGGEAPQGKRGRSSTSEPLSASSSVQVEYGSDLDSSQHGSGFEALRLKGDELRNSTHLYARSIGWNLRALPLLRGSLLGRLPEHVPGVSTPWLYVGMLFSSFCWHCEDSYLFSMNYLHCGASKSWYAAPGSQALRLQQALKLHFPSLFAQQPDAHTRLTLQMSPHVLSSQYHLDVCRTVQSAGEFVCTFPAAYHCGFSHGFNVGEAVNFAIGTWLPFGRQAQEIDRQLARPQCFSTQQLLLTLATDFVHQWEAQRRRQEGAALTPTPASVKVEGEGAASSAQPSSEELDGEVLASEFAGLVAEEQRERTECMRVGVTRFLPMSSSAPPPQCCICATLCFLSYCHCERCRLPPVCLRHVQFACSCAGKEAVQVQYRLSVQQLLDRREALHRAVAAHSKGRGGRSSAAAAVSGNGDVGGGAVPPSPRSSHRAGHHRDSRRSHSSSPHRHHRRHHHSHRRGEEQLRKRQKLSAEREGVGAAVGEEGGVL